MKAVLLLGPTASGKTAVALALAERLPIEIVSVDSAQVFRGLDVGTAKPSPEERARVPHHLIDIVEPTESYSAGRFRDDALRLVAEIAGRGRVPVLAGGTMLYFQALLRGIADMPAARPELRAEIEHEAADRGWERLHARLAEVDPEAARRIEPTDAQRIQRALEVHRITGRPLSSFHAEREAWEPPFESLRVGLEPSVRLELHERIARRFHQMLAAGLLAELAALRSRYRLEGSMPSMRTVGYRQAWETLEGRANEVTLAARGIAATRQLAKRQLTWLRGERGPLEAREGAEVARFDCLRPDLADAVAARVERFLAP